MEKTCRKCEITQSIENFYKRKGTKDGLRYQCKGCFKSYYKEYRAKPENQDRKRKLEAEYKTRPGVKEHRLEYSREYINRPGNRERIYKSIKKYGSKASSKRLKNAARRKRRENDAVRERDNRKQRERCTSNPAIRLGARFSKMIWLTLKRDKGGHHWESIVEYTRGDLIEHLMNHPNKKDGIAMQNYGEWHIDHRIPLRYREPSGEFFWNQDELADPASETFKNAWALDNLQPMWASENNSKGNRYIGIWKEEYNLQGDCENG